MIKRDSLPSTPLLPLFFFNSWRERVHALVLLIREVLFDVVAFICPFPILPQIYEVRIRIVFHTCLKNSSLGKNKSKAVQIGSVPLPRPIISIIATISKMQRLVFL